MLSEWLTYNEREPCPYSQFKVIDIIPIDGIPSEAQTYLSALLENELFDTSFLKAMSTYLGWERVTTELIVPRVPKTNRIKRGTFGEALINAILEQFCDYYIPIRKFRYLIKSDISPPGIDSIAFKTNSQGIVEEVCFIESKLRAVNHYKNKDVGVEGYKQLKGDYESKSADILNFIASRLYDRNDPFFNAFAGYMRDRSSESDIDTFNLSLCWEYSTWDESVLEGLEENGTDLPKLNIHVIRITGLKDIIDKIFAGISGDIEIVEDDD